MTLRLSDPDTGKSIDLAVPDSVLNCFREQIKRARTPKSLEAFRSRLECRIEPAIIEAVNLSIQPPLRHEITRAQVISMMQNVPLPTRTLHHRTTLLKFLQKYPDNEERRKSE
jgi:hypothetical protein